MGLFQVGRRGLDVIAHVAELLKVSEKTVYRWVNDRSLPGYRVSGQYRFNRAELLEWATAQRVNVSATPTTTA